MPQYIEHRTLGKIEVKTDYTDNEIKAEKSQGGRKHLTVVTVCGQELIKTFRDVIVK